MTIDMSIANGASENFKPGPKSATRMGRSNRRHLRRENIYAKSHLLTISTRIEKILQALILDLFIKC